MDTDLKLYIGDRYTIVLITFFPTYMLFEMPSNIVLRKVGTANWLAFIGFAWGTVMVGQGFTKTYQALAACRALLGLFEAVSLNQTFGLLRLNPTTHPAQS